MHLCYNPDRVANRKRRQVLYRSLPIFVESMKKHISILLTFWALLSTVAAIYYWNNNHRLEVNNQTLTESNALHKKLVGVEFESFKIINDCFVVNRGLCNTQEFESKLKTLGDEAESLYDQISILENEKH